MEMLPAQMLRRLCFLMLRLTCIPFFLRQVVQRNKVTILCYHDPDPAILEKHLGFLTTHYNIISLKQFVDALDGTQTNFQLAPKSLIITIDDGHRGNFKLKELIQKWEIPVTIFICSSIVGTRRRFWWQHRVGSETALDPSLIRRCQQLSDAERLRLLAEFGFAETKEYADFQALTVDEIDQLRQFVDFQSHSRLHPILPTCSAERARDEITQSRNELEDKFGFNIYAFAYPNGNYSDREMRLAKSAGYKCALTINGRFNGPQTNPFELGRTGIFDRADINELVVKASGFWDILLKIGGNRSRQPSDIAQ